MSSLAVIGAGAWGTALADLLARNGHPVTLWSHEPEVAADITADRVNRLYFDGHPLDHRLRADHDLPRVVAGAQVICSVTPSHATRQVWQRIAPLVLPGTLLVCASKGVETDTLAMMCDIAHEVLPQATFVALSGPSFAHEVHQQQPTAVVAASEDPAAALRTQQLFSSPTFRVYTGTDVIGVELAGSLKNSVAIGAGMLEGLGLGHNPLAALLTRSLAEIARLGLAMGAKQETFSGLAGMGDLVLTCTGGLSRNRQLGILLAQGVSLAEYRATHRNVAEGVNAAFAAVRIAERLQVDLPILGQIAAVLAGDSTPRESLAILMDRSLRAEHDP